MSDIVKELRDSWDECTDDAADEIERMRRVAAEKIGELVTALGIVPPGEDAVANFDQVIEAARKLRADNERLKAFIADKIHDASREEMLAKINYRGDHE